MPWQCGTYLSWRLRRWEASVVLLWVSVLSCAAAAAKTQQKQQVVVRLAAIGDHGFPGPVARAVAALVRSWEPLDGVISLGDVNYPRGSRHTMDTNVGQYWHMFIHPYKGAFGLGNSSSANGTRGGASMKRNRFFPCPGNHDYGSAKHPDVSAYLEYMPVRKQLFYNQRLGSLVHIFSLDSNKFHHHAAKAANGSAHGHGPHAHTEHAQHRQQQQARDGGEERLAPPEQLQPSALLAQRQVRVGSRMHTLPVRMLLASRAHSSNSSASSHSGGSSSKRSGASGKPRRRGRSVDTLPGSHSTATATGAARRKRSGGTAGGRANRPPPSPQAQLHAGKMGEDKWSPHVHAERLRTQMQQSNAPWRLVFMHHPPYSSGSHGSSPHLRWPFQEFGAVAVLSGHDHSYERVVLGPHSFPYMVNGMGGAHTYGFQVRPINGSAVRFTSQLGGAQLIVADERSITFKFFSTKDPQRAVDCYRATRVALVQDAGPTPPCVHAQEQLQKPPSSKASTQQGATASGWQSPSAAEPTTPTIIRYSACPLEEEVEEQGEQEDDQGPLTLASAAAAPALAQSSATSKSASQSVGQPAQASAPREKGGVLAGHA